MRYWQHVALLYKIGTEQILVDVTNGNIPFLFEYTKSSNQLLGYEPKKSVPVKMAIVNEDFYYHRVAQDIPQNLFFAILNFSVKALYLLLFLLKQTHTH